MVPNSIVYPFNFVNRRGIPLIESSNVEVTDANTVITIANRAFRFLDDRGVFLFRLNQAAPTGVLPVLFSWTGFSQNYTQPVTLLGGEPATGADFVEAGVYLIYYDKSANLIQMITTAA